MATKHKAPGGVEYALVDYDAHNRRLYPTIYKHLGPLSVPFTESVVMVNLAQVHKVHAAFDAINKDASKKGFGTLTFNITDVHPRKASEMRERSIKAHGEQTRLIGKRLIEKLDRLEKRFKPTDDVEKHVYKQRLLIAQAKRDLDEARGVALLFLIEKDAQQAVDASQKIVDAQRKLWQDSRTKQREDRKKAQDKADEAKAAKKSKGGKGKKPAQKPALATA